MQSKFQFGMAFGEGSREPHNDQDEDTLPYNHEWELKMVKETIAAKRRRDGEEPLEAAVVENGNGSNDETKDMHYGLKYEDDDEGHPRPIKRSPVGVIDYDFEKEEVKKAKAGRRGKTKGWFYRDLFFWGRVGETFVAVAPERPLFLFTHPTSSHPGGRSLVAHDHHPFLAVVHLLRHADYSSDVFMSMPYFTDIHVMDELVHYASPVSSGGRDLKIHVVLREKRRNMDYLNSFIDNREDYLDATERVLFHSLSDEVCLCHSKAMCSTAGCMIGSYNYTNAARLCNQEHATLFGPGTSFAQQLMDQLRVQWNSGRALVSVRNGTRVVQDG